MFSHNASFFTVPVKVCVALTSKGKVRFVSLVSFTNNCVLLMVRPM